MSQIILDISANTHKNDWAYLEHMLNELKKVDTGKHEIIIKHQLFLQSGENIPLDKDVFAAAYAYAKRLGYQTTSSVFDKGSLDFLLQFDIPFVKIANNRKLDWLIGEVPRKIPVLVSHGSIEEIKNIEYENIKPLICVSEYPTCIEKYEKNFDIKYMVACDSGISDHTTNFGLWYRYQPEIIEWHSGLPDSTGLDAGPFMRTPAMLAEVL